MLDPKIFKAYDIRATYPDKLNAEVMADVIRAIYTFYTKKLNKRDISVVLGHDMRASSPELYEVAKEILQKSGAKVIDLGLVATPTVYFAVHQYKYDAGIQISASHNPPEYNGVKMVMRDGDRIVKIGQITGIEEIKDIAVNKQFADFTDGGEIITKENVLQDETDEALLSIHPGDVSHLKVVVDPANAMGILPVKELFDRLDATLVMINEELDGTFPAHQPDPLQYKTLRDLQQKVKDEKADVGIATDGDADRAMFIDEKGEIIPATLITTLIAKEILKESPGERILVDIRYTRSVENAVKESGGEVGYTKVGHALITEQIAQENAAFAGESSGHYYFREMGGTESTIRVILYVLRVLAREKKPISEIIKHLHTSIESGETNFELSEGASTQEVMEEIVNDYSDGELSRLDGIAINYPDWRFSIRASNTEPLLRLNVEGKNEEIVIEKNEELRAKILEKGAKIKE